jgi:hypothetical protein
VVATRSLSCGLSGFDPVLLQPARREKINKTPMKEINNKFFN